MISCYQSYLFPDTYPLNGVAKTKRPPIIPIPGPPTPTSLKLSGISWNNILKWDASSEGVKSFSHYQYMSILEGGGGYITEVRPSGVVQSPLLFVDERLILFATLPRINPVTNGLLRGWMAEHQ